MTTRRSCRRWLSGWLVLAILFTQIATAAYACPALKVVVSDASMAGMPCSEMMSDDITLDAAQPGLCLQHCQFGSTQQPSDLAHPVVAGGPAVLPWLTLHPALAPALDRPAWLEHARSRQGIPPTAHSILHCCFRI